MEDKELLENLANLILSRSEITVKISKLWDDLTDDNREAMNNIIWEFKDWSPLSLSLDELAVSEVSWADEVHELAERQGE
jgi:hypothetical protein